ncbi:MAG: hypothetical protein JWP81_3433 [Ferruginibacter sp.]|nr:hypothetical protein [Ferruginibacter sp.]
MRYSYIFLLIAITVFNSSFYIGPSSVPGKVYNFFYLDNSHAKNYQSFTEDMFEMVERKVDSLNHQKDTYLGLYLSNGQKPDFASNYKGAKTIINKLTNGYTIEPNSFFDKSLIFDNVLSADLSYTKEINLHFFVTESYLLNDLMGSNAGLLLNSLPHELQHLLGCDEESVSVVIYYPALSKKIQVQALQKFCNFNTLHKAFPSKIKFQFQPI